MTFRTGILVIFCIFVLSCSKEGPEAPLFSGKMPVIEITTDNGQTITSRDELTDAKFIITDNGQVKNVPGMIRGRGNSSWWNADKKSYRLELSEKTSLLGMHEDKNWCLLANHFDKTMLRNALAFKMSRMSKLDYTPSVGFVEVYLNGSYEGVYLLCETVRASGHREDADFLVEIDVRAAEQDNPWFEIPGMRPVVVKDPDNISSEDLNYLKALIQDADNTLMSDNYLNGSTGYRTIFDVESFVDWYLINEIARNNDAVLYTSCFLHHNRGGKLVMGPVWDFDIAFGNVNYNDNWKTEGLWVANTHWFQRMLSDPYFLSLVKKRFQYFYDNRQELYDFIDVNANALNLYIDKNERRWHSLATKFWSNNETYDNYWDYIESLKKWLEARFTWMNEYYTTL